ncbi:MAG TPA: DEAD/DEAH box helicase, partial [Gemmatimonadaceae bacterium]|nr:DEAD/DEAH box helicase [Gemmatimonadaceae bacterium]
EVTSMDAFQSAPLKLDLWPLVSTSERERLLALPSAVEVRGKWIDVDYDIEDDQRSASSDERLTTPDSPGLAVARLRLPEKLARTLAEAELPKLDRPMRFVVTRGPRGTVRASSLEQLQALLDRPWSPDEPIQERPRRKRDERPSRRHDDRRPGRGGRDGGGGGGRGGAGRRGDRRRRRR